MSAAGGAALGAATVVGAGAAVPFIMSATGVVVSGVGTIHAAGGILGLLHCFFKKISSAVHLQFIYFFLFKNIGAAQAVGVAGVGTGAAVGAVGGFVIYHGAKTAWDLTPQDTKDAVKEKAKNVERRLRVCFKYRLQRKGYG